MFFKRVSFGQDFSLLLFLFLLLILRLKLNTICHDLSEGLERKSLGRRKILSDRFITIDQAVNREKEREEQKKTSSVPSGRSSSRNSNISSSDSKNNSRSSTFWPCLVLIFFYHLREISTKGPRIKRHISVERIPFHAASKCFL